MPKKLSTEQQKLSDRCKKRIPQLQAIPTDTLLKLSAKYKEDFGL